MNLTESIKQLRETTQAGMADCVSALKEASGDFDKAVDILKVKGKNIVSGREGRVAAEGLVVLAEVPYNNQAVAMLEVNCQTDFVARSGAFAVFAALAVAELGSSFTLKTEFDVNAPLVASAKENLISSTKENVSIRRWWIEEAVSPYAKIFHYSHPGNQLGVILTLNLINPVANILLAPDFLALGNDLAMQVAAMNPIAISIDTISDEDKARQRSIFESQLREANKPEASWEKIIAGKFNKWYSEVCLLEQESVIMPKTPVKNVISQLGNKYSCKIEVASMIRCQVGEGLVKEKTDLASEVAKLI
jgi:elongation factor Ts